MKTIVIIDAAKYAEIVSTAEVVLDRQFEGASLTTLFRAVEARISELEGPARQEDQSGAISLEIRILKELLENLTSTGGVPISRTTPSSGC
jgi:hypothetical protein